MQAITQETQKFLTSSLKHIRDIKSIESKLSLHGISYTEFLILNALAEVPQHKMKRIDLAQKLFMSASGITRSLKPMEKIGLVTKESYLRDARISYVKLAPGGISIYNDAAKTMDIAVEDIS